MRLTGPPNHTHISAGGAPQNFFQGACAASWMRTQPDRRHNESKKKVAHVEAKTTDTDSTDQKNQQWQDQSLEPGWCLVLLRGRRRSELMREEPDPESTLG